MFFSCPFSAVSSKAYTPPPQTCHSPYLTCDLHIAHIEEYAGGLLIELQKPASVGGGIHPILCGDAWRWCFASLAANAAQGSVANIFTSTYDNFIQFAGLKDGPSHCAKLLTIMYHNLDSDAQDTDVIIKLTFVMHSMFYAVTYLSMFCLARLHAIMLVA